MSLKTFLVKSLLSCLFFLSTYFPHLFLASQLHAQSGPQAPPEQIAPAPLIINTSHRQFASLAGTWQALIQTLRNPWGNRMIATNQQPKEPSKLIEFSFDNGLTLSVPGDWNTQDDRLFFYRGTVWYKTTFNSEAQANRRYFLYFGAANYFTATVSGHSGLLEFKRAYFR